MGTHYATPTRPKARKKHQCIACLWDIAEGETYICQTGHYEDRAFRNKFHVECWDELNTGGIFEFSPGELDAPERLQVQSNLTTKE